LSLEYTALKFAGISLNPSKTLDELNLKDGNILQQLKKDLNEVPGLIVSYEPDMITFDSTIEFRAKMPCGHVISRESMTDFLRSLIQQRKFMIECPGINAQNKPCKRGWNFGLCSKIGVLSKDERKEFEMGFAKLFILEKFKGKSCPTCNAIVCKPEDLNTNRVACVICSKKGIGSDFCWICMKSWKGGKGEMCGNEECGSKEQFLQILAKCKTKTIGKIKDVPEFRACPKCSTIINHITACKHMQCKSCKAEFCFVCLSLKKDEKWLCGTYNDVCEVAPLQKNI
jgi:hypothetical protein